MKGTELTLTDVFAKEGRKIIIQHSDNSERIMTVWGYCFIDDVGCYRILDGKENDRKYFEFLEV